MLNETNYNSFQSFLESESFQQWVLFPDADNAENWKEYYHKHPDQQQVIDEARNFILALRFKNDKPTKEITEQSLAKALAKIKAKESAHLPIRKLNSSIRIPSFWWAAAALLPILFSVWFIYNYSGNDTKLAKTETSPEQTTTSIEPGTDRAILSCVSISIVIFYVRKIPE